MKQGRVFVFSSVLLMLACSAVSVPGAASASATTLGVAAAHGEQSSQAYDLYVTHTFNPWLEGETAALNPLIEAGLQVWERSERTIWGVNANIGLILRFFETGSVRPFIAGTFGVAQLSADTFGHIDMGTHTQFRSRGSIGVDFGDELRHTIKCNITHYSNAGMNAHNDGYNTLGLSYGLTF